MNTSSVVLGCGCRDATHQWYLCTLNCLCDCAPKDRAQRNFLQVPVVRYREAISDAWKAARFLDRAIASADNAKGIE